MKLLPFDEVFGTQAMFLRIFGEKKDCQIGIDVVVLKIAKTFQMSKIFLPHPLIAVVKYTLIQFK